MSIEEWVGLAFISVGLSGFVFLLLVACVWLWRIMNEETRR